MARGPTTGVFARSGRASQGAARFASQVDEWVNQTEARVNAVFRTATLKLARLMQSTAPYDTGALRASLVATINAPPPVADKTREGASTSYNEAAIIGVISNAKDGDRVLLSYTMKYARRLEYGFVGTDSLGRTYNQPPLAWNRLAAAQWSRLVSESAAEAKASVAARRK